MCVLCGCSWRWTRRRRIRSMPLCSRSVGVRGSDRGFVVSRTSVSASFLPLAPTRQSDSASLLQRIEVGDKIFCTKTSRLINLPLFTPHIASSPPIARPSSSSLVSGSSPLSLSSLKTLWPFLHPIYLQSALGWFIGLAGRAM